MWEYLNFFHFQRIIVLHIDILDFLLLFEREREREREWMGGRDRRRGRERLKQSLRAWSPEPS